MKDCEKKKSRYQYLAGNIALFSVSNFVSKILVFLLVPLYTNVLTTYEYGVADIMQVTLLLLVPALTLNIGEGALRFGIERADKRGAILKIGLRYVLRADATVTGLCLIGFAIFSLQIRKYLLLFLILFIANSMYEFLVLFFQGCEMVPAVVIGSVSSTVLTIASNIIFLLVINIGLYGYIFSQIIAYTFASIIMFAIGKSSGADLSLKEDEPLKNEMIAYGVPLIAYSTGSWVNNAADRYIVALICGAAVNGVYGVAYKIPAILMVFQRIFAQAWQMSATKSYAEKDSERFFTQMYKLYNTFMVIGCAGIILIVKPLASFLFRKEFFEAWSFVPPLLISVIFGALTGFLGSICLAYKDSKSMGIATGCGAVINVALNFATIPYFGAAGAAWATAVSYFVMCRMAYRFVKKHVTLENNLLLDALGYVIVLAEAILMIAQIPGVYIWCTLLFAALVVIYFRDIKSIVCKFAEKFKRKNE